MKHREDAWWDKKVLAYIHIIYISFLQLDHYTGYSYSLSCRMDLWNTMPPCSPFSFHNLHPSAVCQTSGSFTRPVMLESWWRPVMLPVTTKETYSKSRKRKRLFVPESFWSYLNLHLYVSFCLVIKSVQYRLASDIANKINTHFGYTHISLRALILIIITYYHVVYPSIEMFWMLCFDMEPCSLRHWTLNPTCTVSARCRSKWMVRMALRSAWLKNWCQDRMLVKWPWGLC